MKTANPYANPLQALTVVAVLVAVYALAMSGCAVGKGRYDPNTGVYDTNALGDIVVVTAQNTRETALGIFKALMQIEREHEVALRAANPGIHEFVEKLRHESEGWLNELTAATTAYQRTRTAESASKLKSTLTLVDEMLASAAKHLANAARTSSVIKQIP